MSVQKEADAKMKTSKKPYRIALLGGGLRGRGLMKETVKDPSRAELVALAEPVAVQMAESRQEFDLPDERCYATHRELLDDVADLDGAIVATNVATHREVACDCMERGVPIYLEKPIAGTIEDAWEMVSTAERTGTPVHMGFNCRYSPWFAGVRDLALSKAMGKVLAINWTEGIPASMWANDYCRSASYNTRAAIGTLLLEKACHDIDLVNWIAGARCERVAAFGSRRFFVERSDVPERCSPACPVHKECAFYEPTPGRRLRLLPEESNVCVYHIKSDLVDRLRSIYEYEDGTVANINVEPVWSHAGRFVHICGTMGSLSADSWGNRISVRDLKTDVETIHYPEGLAGGHGGGDPLVVGAFLDMLDDSTLTGRATIRDGFETVLMACAADIACKERRMVELDGLRESLAQ